MARTGGVRILAIILICVIIKLSSVHGRKCVCTSKACLEAGVDTCRTRFSCYTELILIDEGAGSTTTRGCTESATPLLCENRPRLDSSSGDLRVRWPRLRCCDSHDYCNGGVLLDPEDHRRPTSTLNRDPVVNPGGEAQDKPSDPPDRYHDKKPLESSASIMCSGNGPNSSAHHQVKPLHVAALVLAVAALISVLAACYVITRELHPPGAQ